MATLLICGCSSLRESSRAKSAFEQANILFNQGNYQASLATYEKIAALYPPAGDRVLFETGIIYAYPKNEAKDYQKALACFQQLIKDFPGSGYRQDSEMMVFYLNNVPVKDRLIATQQDQIGALRQEVRNRENEIAALKNEVAELERKVVAYAMQGRSVDKVLIEKKARRLTLMSRGDVLKTYKIALGGNPVGPKERQGDNKTPEGNYIIDTRNKDSQYHRSLHISYPNTRDRKRAKELGVAPGGDIMIHGIKNGFSGVGDLQATVDWTKGCIAVTDEEIDEIDKLVPNGTTVEIKP